MGIEQNFNKNLKLNELSKKYLENPNDFYKKLFYSRGIAKNEKGHLKNNLGLIDLIKLRLLPKLRWLRASLLVPYVSVPVQKALQNALVQV